MIKREFAKKNLKKVLASSMAMAVLLSSGGFDNLGFVKEAQAAVNVEQTEAVQAVVEKTTDTQTATLSNEERGVIYANSRTDFRDESIYFLITTRFYDGDTSNNARTSEDDNKAHNPESDPSWRGDFKGLIDKLDYIKALGFTAIWITPVVENDSGYDYHGYHAYDFSAVDKRYESNGVTYQTLIDACHEKGIKVIQDVVFNHTCNWGERNLLKLENDVFTKRNSVVMQGGYYYDKAGNKLQDTNDIYHHNGYCGGGDWDEFAAQYKTIADDCLDLNTENPAVYNYLIDCYKKYIDMGVDGFRVDTVKHISRLTLNSTFVPQLQAEAKKNGNNNFYMFGEVCTKGHDVWYRHCPPISTCFYTWKDDSTWTNQWSNDTKSNEALIEAHHNAYNDESIQPTSNNAFLNGNEYHTPDYSKASGLNSIDFQMHWSFNDAWSAFRTATGEDSYFNDSTWNVVYVDSHDYGPDQSQTLRYNGGTDAWAENLSLMFTFRGIPCIYYGSEIEFQAGKVIDPGPNAPLSETGRAYYGDNIEGNVDTVGFTEFGNLDGKVKQTLNKELSQHIMRLNRLRQAIPALRKGQYSTQNCEGGMAFKRRYTDSTTDSFALVTISGDATFTNLPGGTYVDAVTGDTKTISEGGTIEAKVSGKGNMRVYVLSTNKTPAPGRVITNGVYLNDGGAAELIGEVAINQVLPTGITLNKTSASILEGNSVSLTATIAPSNATNKAVTWTSSNTAVATVSGGKVTGIAPGTATITAKTVNNLKATAKITVSENPNIVKVTGIKVSPTSVTMSKGDTKAITATITPSNATDKTVTWSTSDSKVATVSNGTITAVGTGNATITATSSNNLKATVEVTVEGPEITLYDHGVYFEKPSGWNNVYVYLFSNDQTVGAAWPGTKINEVGSGVYGYEYTTTDSNLKVIFNNGGSGDGNQTGNLKYVDNGYYDINGYVKTMTAQGKVIVKYVDESGNQIATSTSKTGDVGSSYTTSAKSVSGYTVKTTPSNAKGTFTKETITVKYVYKSTSAQTGLVTVNGSLYYYNAEGVMQTNYFYNKDGNRYYFGSDGKAITGLKKCSNGYIYYFQGANGVATGLKTVNGAIYYFNPSSGAALGGWRTISGNNYYFDNTTRKAYVTLKNVDGAFYYFTSTGVMKSDYFYNKDGKRYYFGSDGKAITGLKKCSNGYIYYFQGADGVATGLKTVNGAIYYFNPNSGAALGGWITVNGSKYYFVNSTRQACKGLKKIDDAFYYFTTAGIMKADYFYNKDGQRYYFGSDGKAITGLKKCSNGYIYYFQGANGVATGLKTVSGAIYYFNPNSGAALNGWRTIGGQTYFFDNSTRTALTGLNKIDGNLYYFTTAGVMKTDYFYNKDGKRYFFGSDGKAITGLKKCSNGYIYYFQGANGVATGLKSVSGAKYYFNPSTGAALCGWKTVSERTYYFDLTTRKAYTGVHTIDGIKYSFGNDGVLIGEIA